MKVTFKDLKNISINYTFFFLNCYLLEEVFEISMILNEKSCTMTTKVLSTVLLFLIDDL
jgi:hypothetical protein